MNPDLAITPDDVASDLDASRAADVRIADFFAQADAVLPPRTRGATRSVAPPGAGRGLVARCPIDTIKRYHTLGQFLVAHLLGPLRLKAEVGEGVRLAHDAVLRFFGRRSIKLARATSRQPPAL
jgi:hypothetical protein